MRTDMRTETETSAAARMRALVLNGPNINLLGVREPDIYGRACYTQLVELCERAGEQLGFTSVTVRQSNHEGTLVDEIQGARDAAEGIVINSAAYTHTSIAILDALKAVSLPTVEVHLSAVSERESFRQVSYAGMACFATVRGEGIDGHRHALRILVQRLQSEKSNGG